jgi:Putative cyclase
MFAYLDQIGRKSQTCSLTLRQSSSNRTSWHERTTCIFHKHFKQVDALPPHHGIKPDELQQTLAWEKVDLRVGDLVLVRTGTGQFWGETGEDHQHLSRHDTARITLKSAKWLVEQCGISLVGSDASTVEVVPYQQSAHVYLLVEQDVPPGNSITWSSFRKKSMNLSIL